MEKTTETKTTTLTTESIAVGDYVISLRAKEVDEQVDRITLIRELREVGAYSRYSVTFRSKEECQAALELLQGFVEK